MKFLVPFLLLVASLHAAKTDIRVVYSGEVPRTAVLHVDADFVGGGAYQRSSHSLVMYPGFAATHTVSGYVQLYLAVESAGSEQGWPYFGNSADYWCLFTINGAGAVATQVGTGTPPWVVISPDTVVVPGGSSLSIEEQMEFFMLGCGAVAPLLAIALVIRFARRARQSDTA